MTPEEKAKRYDEILEQLKGLIEVTREDKRAILEEDIIDIFFYELKESEDDKIKKSLIILLRHFCKGYRVPGLEFPVSYKDMLNWVERQEEQKTSEWSEEDKRCIRDCIFYLKNAKKYFEKDDSILWNEKWFNSCIDWLEKQGDRSKKVSIWKHWKDGIAGNGEGKQIYLIKVHNTYSLSSCLSFECDYIELSELDELMREEKSSI